MMTKGINRLHGSSIFLAILSERFDHAFAQKFPRTCETDQKACSGGHNDSEGEDSADPERFRFIATTSRQTHLTDTRKTSDARFTSAQYKPDKRLAAPTVTAT